MGNSKAKPGAWAVLAAMVLGANLMLSGCASSAPTEETTVQATKAAKKQETAGTTGQSGGQGSAGSTQAGQTPGQSGGSASAPDASEVPGSGSAATTAAQVLEDEAWGAADGGSAKAASGGAANAPAGVSPEAISPAPALTGAPAYSSQSYPAQRDVSYIPPADLYAGGEGYLGIDDSRAVDTSVESMLTFSLKVDTSAYTNVQRYIESGMLPPADAVKTEELINYFEYDGKMTFNGYEPFAIYTQVGASPFDSRKELAYVRVRSKDIDPSQRPASNLTFLIDTSGSMDSYDKLPLLKEAFKLLVETLSEDDKVSIVTYAGSAGIVLDSVSGADKDRILAAIDRLEASGSTAGADGINTAYKLAEKNYREGRNNRIILATDGDFNVGVSSISGLEKLISRKRETGIYFSILGFGTGNLQDDTMETLAKNGNGNYSYINSASTARKVLVEEMGSNLFAVANDVKAQVEFNPANVKSYRLIGYENRMLANEDFADDTKDAGEIGIGTDVVVLFEIERWGSGGDASDGKKYGQAPVAVVANSEIGNDADELFEVRIRYKNPGEENSNLMTLACKTDFAQAADNTAHGRDFLFASAVAGFAHILRDSEYTGKCDIDDVLEMAKSGLGADEKGYREEFLYLVQEYRRLAREYGE
ncbi:MAG: VWA domain-containing protein [Lachnospiraceae bacterium]|nr:VWA domain-containing protein [Lachnospiraceae bacterium]